ncbi:MAG: hypothetical protein K2X87_06175 [Gemmataceae bacterium]|nr:hypothetical protein [Gemmataceae bacterium]
MLRRVILLSAVAPGLVLGAAGCRHKCCRSDDSTARPIYGTPPAGSFLNSPTGTRIPPPNVPATPPALGPTIPGGNGLPPPADLSPSGGRETITPDPLPPGGSSSRSVVPDNFLGGPVKPPSQTAEPPLARNGVQQAGGTVPAGPAGLPDFVKVKDGVAAGGKPELGGFDTLKQQGYRSVVYLHGPAADVATTREVVEKKGFQFTAIEATPEKLADALTAFNAAVGERAAKPAYVFADAPARAGAVWYAHLRTVDLESDEVAKIRARPLGLTEQGDEARAFWVAVQQYLANR